MEWLGFKVLTFKHQNGQNLYCICICIPGHFLLRRTIRKYVYIASIFEQFSPYDIQNSELWKGYCEDGFIMSEIPTYLFYPSERELVQVGRGPLYQQVLLNIQKIKIMASGPITSQEIDVETIETMKDRFLGSKITPDGDCSHEIKLTLTPWKESYNQHRQHIRKQRHYFANKSPSNQGYGFSSGHVWM